MKSAKVVVRFMKIRVKIGDIFFYLVFRVYPYICILYLGLIFDRLRSWTKFHKVKFIKGTYKMYLHPKSQLHKKSSESYVTLAATQVKKT